MNPNYEHEHELELVEDYAFDESDGDLRILFKHDYYSSDNEIGKKLLNSFINNLIIEADRISVIIIVDCAVNLLITDSRFLYLLQLSPTNIICKDSMEFYGINSSISNCIILDSEATADAIINTSPNIIIE